MNRKICSLAVLVVMCCSCGRTGYIQVSGFAQGGRYSVKYSARGVSVGAQEVKDSIEALLFEIDTSLSGYNPKSQLSRFNAGEKIRPGRMFLRMYSIGYELWERSGGALDFAAGPLYDAWGFGFKSGSVPTAVQVDSLLGICGMKRLPRELPLRDGWLDPALMGFPRLNYNAVAQGYSCDVIASYLYSIGVKDMLVDIGEIWCDGVNPSGRPWTVGIDKPVDGAGEDAELLESVWTSGGQPRGIVTSGNYRKFYVRDGRKYAHTVNPISGYPVDHNLLSATVASSKGAADADALATWCMVLGPEGAWNLLESDASLEGLLICSAPDGSMTLRATDGFFAR